MKTVTKLCGLLGFIGLFGILTASCTTAETPTGPADDDGNVGVGAAALRHTVCPVVCNDGTSFPNFHVTSENGLSEMEVSIRVNAAAQGMCAPHGGLRLRGVCTNWND